MIKYDKLFSIMGKKNIKKKDLLTILNSKSISRLTKNEGVSSETIDKICNFLQCQPGDIMEYINEDGSKPYNTDTIEGITLKGYEEIEKTPQEEIDKMKEAAQNNDTEKLGRLMMDAIMQASGLKDFIDEQLNKKNEEFDKDK